MPETTASVEPTPNPEPVKVPSVDPQQTPEPVKVPSVDPTPSTKDTGADDDPKVKDLEAKLAAARSDAAKARIAKKEANSLLEKTGQYEPLYQEKLREVATLTAEVEATNAAKEATEAELKAVRKELDGYRKSLLDLFQDDDKPFAEDIPTSKLPAFYEKTYGAPMFPKAQPDPSVGVHKTTPRAAANVPGDTYSVSDFVREKYG